MHDVKIAIATLCRLKNLENRQIFAVYWLSGKIHSVRNLQYKRQVAEARTCCEAMSRRSRGAEVSHGAKWRNSHPKIPKSITELKISRRFSKCIKYRWLRADFRSIASL